MNRRIEFWAAAMAAIALRRRAAALRCVERNADTTEFRADGKYRESDTEAFAHSGSLRGSEMPLTFTEDGKQRLRATSLSGEQTPTPPSMASNR